MVERVNTGGNVSFEYNKGKNEELDEERTRLIEQGYEKYYKRKKRNNIIKIVIGIILLIIILGVILYTLY